MSEGFDYGGEIAETVSKFKKADVGSRTARLHGLIRLGTFQESHKGQLKDPAPQAIAIFKLHGKNDKLDDGGDMFFNKAFPLKSGEKSFLHRKANGFISSFNGNPKGFGDMINGAVTLKLVGSKDTNDDGTPKYINFGGMSAIAEDMLELLEDAGKAPADENAVGFLREDQLTKEALEFLHPTLEFAGILMNTIEFKEGRHPCQALIQEIYESDKERYTIPKKDEKKSEEGGEGSKGNYQQSAPQESLGGTAPEQLDQQEEF